ncbi:hypothetical protein HOD30_01645 [Candidatus Peregrinibacteria bacterium]|nr:hypothetical protein [Candidatus Peregrinibacteria bacterium]MBT4632017.1 hypothetical protein [Candidatus Peregrinibacteria bacterium]MBT5516325.1 hypothetical protein [Candidatus Peregrinibacteria bacterium]MBT5824397.1 hypothetical protein [Candidatus Peregrinibacteria bacterium]
MNKHSAFTLIETLIAITFITVVFTAMTGLIITTLNANQRNIHSLQATAFAQEGLEAMRYIRDSNWLQNYAWAGGSRESVSGGSFEPGEAEVLNFYLNDGDCPPCWTFSTFEEDGLVMNESGFEFSRRLEVIPTDTDDAVEVTVFIEWLEKKIPRSIELSTILTDWR